MVGYSKTPLIQKMGIKPGMRAIFLHAPKETLSLFADAPFKLSSQLSGTFDYIHLFAVQEEMLAKEFSIAKKYLKPNGLFWVSWPKGGKLGTDLSENKVQKIGLTSGLVDIKIAAIDETWSGLKFVYRLKDRSLE